MPHRQRARLPRQRRRVGKHRAGPAEQAPVLAAAAPTLLLAAAEILGHHGRVLIGRCQRRVVRAQERDHRVAELGEGHVEPSRLVTLGHVAATLAAGADADHVHRAVAHAVIAVAGEVLGGELPVARDEPLVDAADRLGAALAPVPRVEQQIEIELVAADVVEERRSVRVPGRPDRALVTLHVGNFDQAPFRLVELLAVGVLRERDADEGAVGGVGPAVVRAHELESVPLVVAADLHAAMPARVQEDVDPPRPIAAQDDRLLAHGGHEEVARPGDLALVTDEEPRAREDLVLLPAVDLLVHEDLPADDALVDVDEAVEAVQHRGPPAFRRRAER